MNKDIAKLNADKIQDSERVRRGEEILKELSSVQYRIANLPEIEFPTYQKLQALEMQLINEYNAL